MKTLSKIKKIASRYVEDGRGVTDIPRVEIWKAFKTSALTPVIYDPVCCLVLQGTKKVAVGDQLVQYNASEYFLATVELIALGQIVVSNRNEPYIALHLSIDATIVASVLLDMSEGVQSPVNSGFGVSRASEPLLDAWLRMLLLLENPDDLPVLAGLIEREILFRLLQGPLGGLLRQIAGADSRLSHVRRTLDWIRTNYAQNVRTEELAEMAGMSVSAFHRHFKAVTAMSPIQYQKNFRLHTARRYLLAGRGDIRAVAYSIGYESSSQFSREYARLFGASPSKDVRQLRSAISCNIPDLA